MDELKAPGPWLEETLTSEESEHIIAFAETVAAIKEKPVNEREAALDSVFPYMNSFIHLMYRLEKDKRNLHVVEDGVMDDKGLYFDIIKYSVDFVLYAAGIIGEAPGKPGVLSFLLSAAASPEGNIFTQAFLPMLNDTPTNTLMTMSTKKMEVDTYTGRASYTDGKGNKIEVANFESLLGAMGTSAKKALDASILYLTTGNFYRSGSHINPRAIIPSLKEYWRANGLEVDPKPMPTEEAQEKENTRIENNIKALKKTLKRDLTDLKSINFTWTGTGKNKGSYSNVSLISGFHIKGDTLSVNFDVDMATYLVNSYLMQFPTALLRHDNRDQNGYAIGRKLAFHNGLDNNANRGTSNTLSVRNLLEAAPEITTIEELASKGRRDWKKQIKERLETALDNNISIGYLSRWEYRDPHTGQTYTKAAANALSWDEYYSLMVDFATIDQPNQEARRAARAEEKAKAMEAPPKKKRGRPRKKKEE